MTRMSSRSIETLGASGLRARDRGRRLPSDLPPGKGRHHSMRAPADPAWRVFSSSRISHYLREFPRSARLTCPDARPMIGRIQNLGFSRLGRTRMSPDFGFGRRERPMHIRRGPIVCLLALAVFSSAVHVRVDAQAPQAKPAGDSKATAEQQDLAALSSTVDAVASGKQPAPADVRVTWVAN